MCREMQSYLGLNPESGEDVREESMAVVQLGQVDSVRSIHFFVAETFGALRFIMQLSLPAARNGNMLFLCSSNW